MTDRPPVVTMSRAEWSARRVAGWYGTLEARHRGPVGIRIVGRAMGLSSDSTHLLGPVRLACQLGLLRAVRHDGKVRFYTTRVSPSLGDGSTAGNSPPFLAAP